MTLKIEKFFALTAFVFGCVLIILIPPIQSVDEDSHYMKSYLLANGQIFAQVHDNQTVFSVPDEVTSFIQDNKKMAGDLSKKYTFKQMYFGSWIAADYTAKSYQSFSTDTTNPIAHIVPATGMFIGKVMFAVLLLNKYMTPYNYLLFGRLASLIFYIILLYYSIKITPYFKKTFTFIALLPMTLSLAACISYDMPLIACSFLLIACVLNLAYNDKIRTIPLKYMLAFALIFIFFLNVKYIYLPLFLMLFIIPKQKFGNRRDALRFFGIVCGVGILILIAVTVISRIALAGETGGGTSYSSQQIGFVIGHPLETAVIFLRTISHHYLEYITGVIGKLGWVDTNFPIPYIALIFYFIIILAVAEGGFVHQLNWKAHLLAAILCLAIIGAIFGGMYIYWTSIPEFGGIGAKTIEGVQGRYFIPLLPLMALICSSRLSTVSEKLTKQMKRVISAVPVITVVSLTYTLAIVAMRYWG